MIASLHYLTKSRVVSLFDLPRDLMSPPPAMAASLATPRSPSAGSESLPLAEAQMNEKSLVQNHWNLSKTTPALGVSRPTLYRTRKNEGVTAAQLKSARQRPGVAPNGT